MAINSLYSPVSEEYKLNEGRPCPMDANKTRRNVIRWTLLAAASTTLAGCHSLFHIPPGQIRRQQTPAATGTAPGQAKKKKN
jgi:hypothetical protein